MAKISIKYIYYESVNWSFPTYPIPSPAIDIDTNVNADFTADKLNTAKSYFDITDCWHVHDKCA